MESLVHTDPIWRDRSDFIIGAMVPADGAAAVRRWEQLWARRVSADRFEVCCIPFFLYDVALGDEVETGREWGMEYMVRRVVRRSGRYTYKVWFGDSLYPAVREELPRELADLGYLLEWSSENLLAVDAASVDQANGLAALLEARVWLGHLVFETGFTDGG